MSSYQSVYFSRNLTIYEMTYEYYLKENGLVHETGELLS